MRLRHVWCVLALLSLCIASAGRPVHAESRSTSGAAGQAEASMVVLGTVTVAPDGSVAGYQLDHADALPAAVNTLLQQAIPGWRFEPAASDTRPVLTQTRMSLRVVLHSLGDKRFRLYVAGASFGTFSDNFADVTTSHVEPKYPFPAIRQRVSGTVFVALKIDPQGHVLDASVEQVNLRIAGTDSDVERFRGWLADSALDAVRKWVFNPKALGGGDDVHYAIVPIDYWLEHRQGVEQRPGSPGHWDVYIPGPRQPLPWLDASSLFAGSSDALPAGGVFVFHPGAPRLRSALGGT